MLLLIVGIPMHIFKVFMFNLLNQNHSYSESTGQKHVQKYAVTR